ncbi:Acyl-CoA thioesterase II [Minicystis rosea]|nr:Acyl-CoA thioesterase II [Minicystis rosea]
MSTILTELVHLLALERIEEDIFRGQSQDLGWGTIFGGQVLGQALSAAAQTVPQDRLAHSLHAYFLRPGDASRPVVYEVDRIRDGSSFTTRRVVAVQRGQAIFHLDASFQREEAGFEHADPMPAAPDPESLPTEQERLAPWAAELPIDLRKRALGERPFESRLVGEDDDPLSPTPRPPRRMLWFRTVAPLPDDPSLHRHLLAYASDHMFITTSLLPHGASWRTRGMQVASIDHAIWFHQPVRADEWMLHVIDSPAAHGARGLVRGQIFTRDGRLVASTMQEGLIRHRAPAAK